jgi:hypothetical protein
VDNPVLTKLALISRRACEDPAFQFTSLAHLLNAEFLRGCYWILGKEKASGFNRRFYFTVAVKGDWLKSRMREIFKSGSVRGVKLFYKAEYCGTPQSKEEKQRIQSMPKRESFTSTRPIQSQLPAFGRKS